MPITPSAADVLIVVDVQYDFLPGGALAVPDGFAVIAPINALARRFRHVVLTQDWHPPGHASFASSHPGKAPFETAQLPYGEQILWPDHCVQGTPGAAIHESIDIPHAALVIRKGHNRAIDSYSGFVEADRKTPTGLAGYLKERGVDRVFCRRARDRFLRRLDRHRRRPGRLRGLCHRGRVPRHRRAGLARQGVGRHGRRRRAGASRRRRSREKPDDNGDGQLHRDAVQVVGVGALDLDGDDVAGAQRAARGDVDIAVDLRRVPFRAALGDAAPASSTMTGRRRPTLALRSLALISCCAAHEAVPALLLDLVRHGRGDVVGRRAARPARSGSSRRGRASPP